MKAQLKAQQLIDTYKDGVDDVSKLAKMLEVAMGVLNYLKAPCGEDCDCSYKADQALAEIEKVGGAN